MNILIVQDTDWIRKLYEYMAMSKPIISTKLPGVMKEFGYYNGIVYVDCPEETIERAVQMSDGDLQAEGGKAREFVKGCDWDAITAEYERILIDQANSKARATKLKRNGG